MFYLPNIVFEKLSLLQIGNCSCMTKTPELKYHKELCRYRLAAELKQELEKYKAPHIEVVNWPPAPHRTGPSFTERKAERIAEARSSTVADGDTFYCGITGTKMVYCSTCPGRECIYGNKEKKHD